MSYPRKVHSLIVEDEDGPRRAYELLFNRLAREDPTGIALPTFATSFEDAARHLSGPQIFHLIILDMGLPEKTRQSVPEGVEPGMRLLATAAKRDHCPVPVVLVISGRLGGSTDVPQIRKMLDQNFWYGQFLNKGADNKDDEILHGIAKSREYCDVGIHVRDSGIEMFPTLSPREEDLLRRCSRRETCLGIDLQWWSAESFEVDEHTNEWKKVLMGNFLLDSNYGHSNHVFFKFEPARDAGYAHSAAAVASKKLKHVKKVDACTSGSRSLLVTESVCTAVPVPLDTFLLQDPAFVQTALPGLVDEITQQLDQLGDSTELTMPVKEIMWPYFQREKIQQAIGRWMTPEISAVADVMQVYERLSKSTVPLWVRVRQCNHGDLHAKNVAVDVGVKPPRAFIFDAGAMSRAVNVRDLALLEVTTLLFQEPPAGVNIIEACADLYGATLEPAESVDVSSGPVQVQNTRKFLAELRRNVARLCEPQVYALSVFDHALMEFSGLAVQSTRNKIASPVDAARLAAITAAWLRRLAPTLFDSE